MYYYKIYDSAASFINECFASKEVGQSFCDTERIKIAKAIDSIYKSLDLEKDNDLRVQWMAQVEKGNTFDFDYSDAIDGMYRPKAKQILLNYKSNDLIPTLFHEFYHYYLDQNGCQYSFQDQWQEEDEAEAFSQKMMKEYFNEEYEPVTYKSNIQYGYVPSWGGYQMPAVFDTLNQVVSYQDTAGVLHTNNYKFSTIDGALLLL